MLLAAIPNWTSSGHLRRCNDGNTTIKSMSRDKDASILSWPTLMGHYKQLADIIAVLETIWCRVAQAIIPNWTSSGHLRHCNDGDTTIKSLRRDKDASILSWPTIMGHYKLCIAILAALETIWCRVAQAIIPNWTSSGHQRRCNDGSTTTQSLSRDKDASILSWPTLMGHYKLLIAILAAWDTIW
eukprot:scaffold18405_cov89-Skeletonema_dohrnii-CCMP3373.AAC.1